MANEFLAPKTDVLTMRVPGQATAGTDSAWNIGEVPYDATVTAVSYTPDSTITGHASNNRTFSVINKGTDGTGTTSIATKTTTADVTGDDESALTLSGTAANLNVSTGQILEFNSDANSSGVADPGGLVQVTLARR